MSLADQVDAAVKQLLDTHEEADAQLAAENAATIDRLTQQVSEAELAEAAAVQALADYKATHPDPTPPPPPPPVKTIFSAYPGPLTIGGDAQSATARKRVATALGVTTLPVDRVYGGDAYSGKATQSPSPTIAVSIGSKWIKPLGAGDATAVKTLQTELASYAARPTQQFHLAGDHENDAKIRKGTYTAADVAKGHAAIKKIVDAMGLPNVEVCLGGITGWVLSNVAKTDPSYPTQWFHPENYDRLTIDAYWVTQKTIGAAFDPARDWALQWGLPLAVWETGWSTDSNPQSLTDTQAAAKVQAIRDYWRAAKFDYVLFFESAKGDNLFETRPQTNAVWAAAAQGK